MELRSGNDEDGKTGDLNIRIRTEFEIREATLVNSNSTDCESGRGSLPEQDGRGADHRSKDSIERSM